MPIPRILEFEDGRIKITPEAYTIPEIHSIITSFGEDEAERYLAYVMHLSYPDSAYRNLPIEDQAESALYDVKQTLGDFDHEHELVQPAIERLRGLWESANTQMADQIEQELHGWRIYLRDTPIGGDEMKNRLALVAQIEKTALSAVNLRKIADDEIATKMKGANTMGEY